MLSNFRDNSFKPVCSAIGYKFLGGSLINYAVNKEKMLLKSSKDFPKSVILYLIVFGLLSTIIKSLNRKNVISIKTLKEKLKKYESEEKNFDIFSTVRSFGKSNNKNSSQNFSRNFDKSSSSNNISFGKKRNFYRKYCSICAAKGVEHFHSESTCWFIDRGPLKAVNNVEAESTFSSDETTSKN